MGYKVQSISYNDGKYNIRFPQNHKPISITAPIGVSCDIHSKKECVEIEFRVKKAKYSQIRNRKLLMLGNFEGKPLYWTKLCRYDDGTDLYLLDDILCTRIFDKSSNDWSNSELAEWLSFALVECFTPYDYNRIVPIYSVGKVGHKIFLLSIEEYIRFKRMIPRVSCCWWLRSSSSEPDHAMIVYDNNNGLVNTYSIRVDTSLGVRPAIRLRREKQ